MPVIIEGVDEGAPSRPRRRGGKGFWLLLLLPALAVGVVIASFLRPIEVQMGPYMAVAMGQIGAGNDWGIERGIMDETSEGGDAPYVVTGRGAYFAVLSPAGGVGFAWFRGHRAR